MRQLDVFLGDNLVGHVIENRKGGRFEYEQSVADKLAGRPVLSMAFPAKGRPFGEAKTSAWFNGLLPEGSRRDEICRSLGVSPYDWIGLLAEIGWECAGAVRVFERGHKRARELRFEAISPSALAEKLSSVTARLPQVESELFRMSLGGFQEKMCVVMPTIPEGTYSVVADDVLLPMGDSSSTHILKPESEHYPGLAESEAWAMTAAGHAARASRVALLDLDDAPGTLVVERYDRVVDDISKCVARLHQEDACQALGIDPHGKYATASAPKGDDPTYVAIADLLQKYSSDPEGEKEELLRQLVANLALGNWDAHAKNTSFLYREQMVPELAPLYDVVPIAEVEPRTGILSMRVNGVINPEKLTRADIIAEAASWGLNAAGAETVIDCALRNLEEGIRAASMAYPGAASRHEANALGRVCRLKRDFQT